MAGRKMNWNRAKRRQGAHAPKPNLERAADKLLAAKEADKRDWHSGRLAPSPARIEPEHIYYRSVGTVIQKGDRWIACGENGLVLGEFAHRWEAWRLADKLGLEQVGA